MLFFSDAHLDQSTAGLRRIDDLEGAFKRVLAYAIEREVSLVVFKGDLADPDCGSILVRVLDAALGIASDFAAHGIASRWVRGNHDVIEDGSGLSTLTPVGRIKGARVFDRPEHEFFKDAPFRDVEVLYLPYPSRASIYDPAQYMQGNPFSGTGARVVIGHCTSVRGAVAGSETNDLARGGNVEFPIEECKRQNVTAMFNGHFHAQQTTPDGVHICGSLERLRFDEEHNHPGILIAEV